MKTITITRTEKTNLIEIRDQEDLISSITLTQKDLIRLMLLSYQTEIGTSRTIEKDKINIVAK